MKGSWEIRILYDGECPLCSREIRFLERRDRGRKRIEFEDISRADFDPATYGLDARHVMARIHGVLPDGSVTHPTTGTSRRTIQPFESCSRRCRPQQTRMQRLRR